MPAYKSIPVCKDDLSGGQRLKTDSHISSACTPLAEAWVSVCSSSSAGTLHAICRGIILAEIQQNFNVTYCVYNYGCLGAGGRPRTLHIRQALDAAVLRPTRQQTFAPHIGECEYFPSHFLQNEKNRRQILSTWALGCFAHPWKDQDFWGQKRAKTLDFQRVTTLCIYSVLALCQGQTL